MTDDETIREGAKAAPEVAKATGKGIDLADKAGGS